MTTTLFYNKTKTLTILALLAAAAVALRFAEGLLPVTIAPGLKPGLANSVTLLCLYLFPLRQTALYLAVRVMLTALLFTGLFTPAFCIGTTGAVLSLTVMYAAKCSNVFSLPGVSVAGACAHNLGQLIAACLLMQSTALFSLLPVLIALSIPFGLLTGFIAQMLLRLAKINAV